MILNSYCLNSITKYYDWKIQRFKSTYWQRGDLSLDYFRPYVNPSFPLALLSGYRTSERLLILGCCFISGSDRKSRMGCELRRQNTWVTARSATYIKFLLFYGVSVKLCFSWNKIVKDFAPGTHCRWKSMYFIVLEMVLF